MEIIYTVLAVVACILLFSFAVFIHEFGHFVAAKLLGFKVEVFSIGFGPALWKKTYKGVPTLQADSLQLSQLRTLLPLTKM